MPIPYFVLRPGAPYRGLQFVVVNYATSTPGCLQIVEGDPMAPLTWSLAESEPAQVEKEHIRELNLGMTGTGLSWNCRISKYYLCLNEAPHVRIRILSCNTGQDALIRLPPRKDTIVIPLTDKAHQHTISATHRAQIDQMFRNPNTVQWFQEGKPWIRQQAPDLAGLAARIAADAPDPVGIAALDLADLAARIAARIDAAAPDPVGLAAPDLADLAAAAANSRPLNSYIANTLVQHARTQPDAHCPISFEPLTECTQFHVGSCGHVYSDAVAGMQTCPMCKKAVAWTAVEVPA